MGIRTSFGSTPSNQPPVGNEIAPVVRPIGRKFGQSYNPPLIPSNGAYFTPWVDTNLTGDVYVQATCLGSQASASTSFQILQTDDPNAITSQSAGLNIGAVGSPIRISAAITTAINTTVVLGAAITSRYWCIRFVNGGVGVCSLQLTSCAMSQIPFMAVAGVSTTGNGQTLPIAAATPSATPGTSNDLITAPGLQVCLGGAIGDQSLSPMSVPGVSGAAGVMAVIPYFITASANPGNLVRQRTPNIFKGFQFSAAGAVQVWPPAITTNKIRLMQYAIEVGEDATITSGPLPVNVGFAWGIGTASGNATANAIGYTHRFVAPSAVLATAFDGYLSGLITLGNGAVSNAAGCGLFAGLMVPQTTGAVTPTFTIPSAEWEAGTFSFKTKNNSGNFRLLQSATGTASAASVVVTMPQTFTQGSLIFVVVRTTNPVGGAPTITITDNGTGTADTWTNLAANTDTHDTTNGSTIQASYCLSIVSTPAATQTVTATCTATVPTVTQIIILEYAGCSGVVGTAAQVITNTNGTPTTSPSSGAFTPGEAGDLVLTYFASGSNTALPTVNSNFFLRGSLFNNSGSLTAADNFGNGALAAGLVNLIMAGVEE